MLMKTFGENLKRARRTLGLTQRELAEKLDMHISAIAHFENGVRQPSLPNIRKIYLGLGCSPNVLITF